MNGWGRHWGERELQIQIKIKWKAFHIFFAGSRVHAVLGLNSGPYYSLRHYTSHCLWWVFRDRVSQTICPVWLWTAILLISASWEARITGVRWLLAFPHYLKVPIYNIESKPSMVAHTCNPRTQESRAGGLQVWGQLGLHMKFSVSPGYIARLCLRTKTWKHLHFKKGEALALMCCFYKSFFFSDWSSFSSLFLYPSHAHTMQSSLVVPGALVLGLSTNSKIQGYSSP
jgi:hypothetical protein